MVHQVVLLTSSTDRVTRLVAEKLAKNRGCQVVQVGENPPIDLEEFLKLKHLDWKHVAYMGKRSFFLFCVCVCVLHFIRSKQKINIFASLRAFR